MSNVKIIAEIGVNHNGDVNLAKKLVERVHIAGADIVKFQTYDVNELVHASAQTAQYQRINTAEDNQHSLLKKLQLSDLHLREIFDYCAQIGIEFLSTGFEERSLSKLLSLGMKRIKIPSGEITNIPFLKFIADKKLPIILSTGMSSLKEVRLAYETLKMNGAKDSQITILHCTSNYPALDQELNLRAITTIASEIGVNIGYSDHSLGKEAAIGAVSLGATIIEKHVTLDRNMKGPDHKASMELAEFKEFVTSIRRIEVALGKPQKEPSPSEYLTRALVRKSIISSREIEIGETFNESNLTTKRPGTGLSPILWDQIIGKSAKRNYLKDEFIDDEEI